MSERWSRTVRGGLRRVHLQGTGDGRCQALTLKQRPAAVLDVIDARRCTCPQTAGVHCIGVRKMQPLSRSQKDIMVSMVKNNATTLLQNFLNCLIAMIVPAIGIALVLHQAGASLELSSPVSQAPNNDLMDDALNTSFGRLRIAVPQSPRTVATISAPSIIVTAADGAQCVMT